MDLRSIYRKCRFCQKKITFSDEAHFDLGVYVNKQNCLIWYTENPHSYITGAPKTSHCLARKNWIGGYCQHLVSTGRRYVPHSRSYTRCFAPCFSRSQYQSQSWYRLAISELRFDTVGLLFIGCRQATWHFKVQLHTIDNVLKNWTNRADHWMKWNYFPLFTGRINYGRDEVRRVC